MVKKLKSRNLRGETRKEERKRIIEERAEAIVSGKSRSKVRKIGGKRARVVGLFGE